MPTGTDYFPVTTTHIQKVRMDGGEVLGCVIQTALSAERNRSQGRCHPLDAGSRG